MFLYVSKNLQTGKMSVYRIDRYRNDLYDFVRHLREDDCEYYVSFNGLSFDSQVIQYILENYSTWEGFSALKITGLIYQFAQDRIDDAKYNLRPPFKEFKLWKKQVDLFKIHHYDNKGRRCSLKWLEFSMDFPNIEEMPIDHKRWDFTQVEVREIIFYCINDVMATERLYLITRGITDLEEYAGKDKIQERFDIISEFNLSWSALSWSDVRIGDELNRVGYIRESGLSPYEVYELKEKRTSTAGFTFSDCIPKYVQFKTPKFQEFLARVKDEKVYLKKKQEFIIEVDGTSYMIKKGGIHSMEKKRMLVGGDGRLIIDADVGSQYPNAIVKRGLFPSHLGPLWLINYKRTIELRLKYKALSQDTSLTSTERKKYKGLAEFLKLALNGGGFGKTNEPTNWQYDPKVQFSCTIGNQFEMLMLIESLLMEGIKVVSANTDGIVCQLAQEKESRYYEICREWEKIVGNNEMGKLEYTHFDKIIQTSVNDYLGIKSNGEIKRKGDFAISTELHKNKSRRIIPIAIEKHFVNNIPIEQTIRQHQNVFDFCVGVKSSKDYHYEGINIRNGEKDIYHRVIRYYMTEKGKKLVKVKNPESLKKGKKLSQCEAGKWLSEVINTYKDQNISDLDIDYNYYIHKCNEIIQGLETPAKRQKKNPVSQPLTQLSIF
ncbi:hypothetical protein [Chitinophaga sp. YR573]|uniref:hypothetical protein n=1 Tax=Chitinophaga sp. YR573 TaxID=1881040 RepID=UPI00115FADA5|nr:hypothetical protein [Chitinophaga sp. YR573]